MLLKPYSTEVLLPPIFEDIQQGWGKSVPHGFAAWVAEHLPAPAQRSLQILIRTDDYTVHFTHEGSNVFIEDIQSDQQGELYGSYLLNDAQFNKKQVHLDLSELGFFALDTALFTLKRLQSLNLSHNNLTELPSEIVDLPQLSTLLLAHNNLAQLPDALSTLTKLTWLDVSYNQLKEWPPALASLPDLQAFYCAGNLLDAEHLDLSLLPSTLRVFDVRHNALETLPDLHPWRHLQQLSLSANQLQTLPALPATLRYLYVDNNRMESLPEELQEVVPELRVLSCAQNKLTQLPPLTGLVSLRVLDVQRNLLSTLGEVVLSLPLERLMAQGNPLQDAPPEVHNRALLDYYRDPTTLDSLVKTCVEEESGTMSLIGRTSKFSMIQADWTRFLLEDGQVERHSSFDVYRKEWSIYDHFLISQTTAYYKEHFHPHGMFPRPFFYPFSSLLLSS